MWDSVSHALTHIQQGHKAFHHWEDVHSDMQSSHWLHLVLLRERERDEEKSIKLNVEHCEGKPEQYPQSNIELQHG